MGLTQKKFGSKLGITGSAVCNYENGSRTITEQVIMAICREYNVNRSWLIDGIGDMFICSPDSILDKLAMQFELNEEEIEFIRDFCKLSKEQRDIVLRFMRGI